MTNILELFLEVHFPIATTEFYKEKNKPFKDQLKSNRINDYLGQVINIDLRTIEKLTANVIPMHVFAWDQFSSERLMLQVA